MNEMSEVNETRIKELLNAAIDAGKSQNECIASAYFESGGDTSLNRIQSIFREVASERGLTPDTESRKAIVVEAMAKLPDPTNVKARRELIDKLSTQLYVAESTISNDISAWLKEQGIDISRQNKFEDIKAFVEELLRDGKSRKEIIEAVAEEFEYSEGTAGSTVSKVFADLGIAPSRSSVKHFEIMAVYQLYKTKKETAIKLMQHFGNCSENTARGMFSLVKYFDAYKSLVLNRLSEGQHEKYMEIENFDVNTLDEDEAVSTVAQEEEAA